MPRQENFQNLIGQKFNQLLVLKHIGNDCGNHIWLCKCDCGNETEVRTCNLLAGEIKSCGCVRSKITDLSGKKFGKLLAKKSVIIKIDSKKRKKYGWICDCDCGTKDITIRSDALLSGKTTSCGCLQKTGFGEISGSMWGRIQRQAKERNLEISVTKEHIWQLWLDQKGKCALTNWDIELHYSAKIPNTASLDRKDSTKGYIEGNLQWTHIDANFSKQEYSQEYYLKICRAVVENHDRQNQELVTPDGFNEEYW